ncbi:alginate O-acetyltransferase AlgF [Marinobacter sp. M216]|uniref:Alginate biosynthesis protein AlgF n=1 Tax=Marinobacter albus TaxID=3030833 RepID=A0ABT7HAF3_9GAMM|nr:MULTISPECIES: alginate O-acetyltransferase AlgF [unclassified Marinobacter]MBW7470394.1 alginate O-acetyltransferase AlgF [Marinobacter sp. F4218]MDK9557341.1 alginate O-acetyltransferase AlgF [Marinobacter sp. M216]
MSVNEHRSLVVRIWAAALIYLLCAIPAQAEDALYAADAPDGVAFIRVLNAGSSGELESASAGGKRWDEIAPLEVSPYLYLPPGSHSISAGGASATVDLQKDQFYTAVVLPDGRLEVLKDRAFENPRKALVSFYNLTDSGGVSLKTADGKVAVIENLGSLEVADREINAVKLAFGAFEGSQVFGTSDPMSLQRGRVYSFFAVEVAGRPRFFASENRVDASL